MKLKITQAGYQTFNGMLGDVTFVEGVSVADVSKESAAGITAIYQAEFIEEVPELTEAPDADVETTAEADPSKAEAKDESEVAPTDPV